MSALLQIRDLRVRYGALEVVGGISLDLKRGEIAAIVGESGSGKSQAMLAALGLLPSSAVAGGAVLFEGENILGASAARLNALRGKKISMIFQEPKSTLDPLFPVGAQIGAVLRNHENLSRKQAQARAIELMELAGIADPLRRARSYPHELSGGQAQRICIAMAIACNPQILIADEPTTALDVTVQARILDLLVDLKQRLGMAMIFISHDLRLVRRFADTIHVMRDGAIVESGTAEHVMQSPQQAYTRMLIAAEPSGEKCAPAPEAPALIAARNISVSYPQRGGLFERAKIFKAVDDVSIQLRRGQTLGLVGESGSGKSTFGRALLKLTPTSGLLRFEDRDLGPLDRSAMRPLRRQMQLVFQDPYGSLSPRMAVGHIITEGLLTHEPAMTRLERAAKAAQALEEVGLSADMAQRYPHEFSGGQRQRIAIARALILAPKLVVLDEPTSALDRSVQMDIMALLKRLQAERALTYLFISHDLAVVRAMADEIAVMKDGRIIEQGGTQAVLEHPREAYTQALVKAAMLA